MISVIIQYIEYCIRVYIDIYASKALAVVYTAIVEPGTTFNMPNVIQALTVTVFIKLRNVHLFCENSNTDL